MPLFFIDEEYNGSNNVDANSGNWVSSKIDFLHIVRLNVEDLSEEVNEITTGGVKYYERVNGSSWNDIGFVGGKTIRIQTKTNLDDPWSGGFIRTIDYIDDSKMFIEGIFPSELATLYYPSIDEFGNQIVFLRITQQEAPESLEFDFNLTIPDSPSLESIIDGEINRFKFDGLSTMLIGDTEDFDQINSKSGGYIIRPKVTYISLTDGFREYSITFLFMQWGFLQDGFAEPEYLDGVQTLGPILNARVFSQLGNPNSILQGTTSNNDGNIGGFNENYNTGLNPYNLNSIVFTSGVEEIEAIDYCGTTHFVAKIQGPDFDITNSAFTIGLTWRTVDDENYFNKLTDFGQNTATLAPVNQFVHSPSPDATLYNGNVQPDNGMQWSFQNLQFFISGSVLTVEGDIIPTGTNEEAFEELGFGEKKISLWVSPSRGDIPNSLQKRTSILLHNKDAICAPPAPTSFAVTSVKYTDHADLDVTGIPSLTPTSLTTEDDSLYAISFNLVEDNVYESLTHQVLAYNTVTGLEFTLEELSVDFSDFPYIDGKHEIYFEQIRPFNLSPSTNKNVFSLHRDPDADIGDLYHMFMNYGFLDRWEYWLAQINASDEFYNPDEPNNGLNKDWQHYSGADFGDWTIRMRTNIHSELTYQQYVNDFEIRPYDDENATTEVSFVNLADMSTPDAPVNNTFMEVTATITWLDNFFNPLNFWAQATIEDFESANRWTISSYLEHEGVADNPLQPIDGATKLDVNIIGAVVELKYIINTNIIDAKDISITHRVFSNPQGVGFAPLTEDEDIILTESGDMLGVE